MRLEIIPNLKIVKEQAEAPLPCFRLFRLYDSVSKETVSLSDAEFLTDILRDGILVDEEVHGLAGNESLGHVPGAFVVAIFAP